jgi:DNA polymerase-3 subunit alpha
MKLIAKKLHNFKGKVYDLTVENSHSYNINGAAVHNSAPGSLVLYAIGVTNIDPIKHDLFFERFVSKSRARKIEHN